VRRVTGGALQIEDGALYTSLHRMEGRGWIASEWGVSDNNRRAKYYSLTTAGRAELTKASKDWERYADAVFKVLRSDSGR
jgi:DNA-binding PadR family transcriptional regulator